MRYYLFYKLVISLVKTNSTDSIAYVCVYCYIYKYEIIILNNIL